MTFVLASASPRRVELLRAAGFTFEAVAADVDERVRPGESPERYVRRLAADKSYVVAGSSRPPGSPPEGRRHVPILGADTAVVVDGDILGKPRDEGDARSMLRRLSGRRHEVLTGISWRLGGYEVGRVEATTVQFVELSEGDIAWYLSSGEWRDKAGGYAIQGLASRFIPRIDGSYSNVVGLPIAAVVELFAQLPGHALHRT